ncbi:phosphoethanolamine N-methyltransferase 3 [Trichonephila clavipes]|nr:phosphoethanolamine N-methyltransferase 3 [Trichonephila clavipes]
MSRTTNPTFYRTPAEYASLLESAWVSTSDSILEPSEEGFGYKTINVGSLRSYIKVDEYITSKLSVRQNMKISPEGRLIRSLHAGDLYSRVSE